MVAVLIATLFSGCKLIENTVISEDGKVTVEHVYRFTKSDYDILVLLKAMYKEDFVVVEDQEGEDPSDLKDYKPETIDGVDYMTYKSALNYDTFDAYKKYLNTQSPLYHVSYAKNFSTTDLWAAISTEAKKEVVRGINQSNIDLKQYGLSEPYTFSTVIKFPYVITKTNLTKIDDYTVEINFSKLPSTNTIYVITQNSTANWTKAENVDEEINKMSFKAGAPILTNSLLKNNSTAFVDWFKYDNAKGYYYYEKVGSGNWSKGVKLTATSYTKKKLKKGTKYSFRIQAFKIEEGKEVLSKAKTLSLTTLDTSKKPTLKLKAAKQSFTVDVSKVNGADGYEIYYSRKSNKGFKSELSQKNKYTKNKLKAKTTYYVKVRAYKSTRNGYVYSKYSAVKSVKTK